MKPIRPWLAAWLVALSMPVSACTARAHADAAPQASGQTRTITGQIVCLVCYARNKANTGADHDDGRMCAQACIKWEGNPAGVLTSDGTVYQLAGAVVANNNAKIAPHIARRISVTGEVYEKDGMKMIKADDIKPAQ
jgi:hypothetical protein